MATFEGYSLSLHDALPILLAVVGARAQGVTLEVEPAGPPLIMKLTVPTGGLFVPLAVSCTVTVQLSGLLTGVDGGQSNVGWEERTSELQLPYELVSARML